MDGLQEGGRIGLLLHGRTGQRQNSADRLAAVPEELSRAVAREISRLLEERAWSGRELARRTGIHYASISRKLAGGSSFDLDDVQKVCAALDVDVAQLISWAQRA
jgi:DNA-binding Xre family transcriptional regulator